MIKDVLKMVEITIRDTGQGIFIEKIDGQKPFFAQTKPILYEQWSKVRESIEVLTEALNIDWRTGIIKATPSPWSDEELKDFLIKLNLNQKALLYAASQLQEPTKKELLGKINELLRAKGRPELDKKNFTAVKGSLTRHFSRLSKEELIPSQFTTRDYWTKEESRYRVNEKYRDRINKILSNYF